MNRYLILLVKDQNLKCQIMESRFHRDNYFNRFLDFARNDGA